MVGEVGGWVPAHLDPAIAYTSSCLHSHYQTILKLTTEQCPSSRGTQASLMNEEVTGSCFNCTFVFVAIYFVASHWLHKCSSRPAPTPWSAMASGWTPCPAVCFFHQNQKQIYFRIPHLLACVESKNKNPCDRQSDNPL